MVKRSTGAVAASVLAWAMAAAAGGSPVSTSARAATYGITPADSATAGALRRARALIGDDAALQAVSGFAITSANATSRREYRVRLPNRFRVDYSKSTTAMDGGTYWQLLPPGITDTQTDGRREHFLRTMLGWCINLLLRAPEAYPMTARSTGQVSIGGLQGESLELRTADGTVVHRVVLDAKTGRLVGALSHHRTSAGEAYTLVERFEAHRRISGLNVPMEIHQTRIPDDKASAQALGGVFRIGSLVFSPPPGPEVFRRPTPR